MWGSVSMVDLTENIGQSLIYVNEFQRASFPDNNVTLCQKWVKLGLFPVDYIRIN